MPLWTRGTRSLASSPQSSDTSFRLSSAHLRFLLTVIPYSSGVNVNSESIFLNKLKNHAKLLLLPALPHQEVLIQALGMPAVFQRKYKKWPLPVPSKSSVRLSAVQ